MGRYRQRQRFVRSGWHRQFVRRGVHENWSGVLEAPRDDAVGRHGPDGWRCVHRACSASDLGFEREFIGGT
jgi:hypothetical protein